MTLEHAYFFAEIMAAVAVVTSLIYLGIQIKQSRIQSENAAMDEITQRRSDFIEIIARDIELSFIIAKGLASKKTLTANEYFRFTSYLFTVFVGLEIGFIKWYRKGLNKEIWYAWDQVIHWWLQFPSVQKWWQSNTFNGYTADFNHYIQSRIAELTRKPTAGIEKVIDFLEEASSQPEQEREFTANSDSKKSMENS